MWSLILVINFWILKKQLKKELKKDEIPFAEITEKLEQIEANEAKKENRTLSTMPKSSESNCFQCMYESKIKMHHSEGTNEVTSSVINSSNFVQAIRLAHSYFFKEELDDAILLYQICHRYLANLTTGDCTTGTVQTESKKHDQCWASEKLVKMLHKY